VKSVGVEGLETRNLTSEVHVRAAALRAGRALGRLGARRPERALAPGDGGGRALERDGGGADVPANALAVPAHLRRGGAHARRCGTGYAGVLTFREVGHFA
jgi:hypothetical protein